MNPYKFCDACALPIPPYHWYCQSCPPPVINLNGGHPTIALFSQVVVALETYGQVTIKGSAIADNPGGSLILMGACIANTGLPSLKPQTDWTPADTHKLTEHFHNRSKDWDGQ